MNEGTVDINLENSTTRRQSDIVAVTSSSLSSPSPAKTLSLLSSSPSSASSSLHSPPTFVSPPVLISKADKMNFLSSVLNRDTTTVNTTEFVIPGFNVAEDASPLVLEDEEAEETGDAMRKIRAKSAAVVSGLSPSSSSLDELSSFAFSSAQKGFGVASQWAKERFVGVNHTEEDPNFAKNVIARVQLIDKEMKEVEKKMRAVVKFEQRAILAHEALAKKMKEIYTKENKEGNNKENIESTKDNKSTTPTLTKKKKAKKSPDDEEEYEEEESLELSSEDEEEEEEQAKINPIKSTEQTESTVAKQGDVIASSSSSFSPSSSSYSPSPSYLSSFYPYQRRLLSYRLHLTDERQNYLASLHLLLQSTLKSTLAHLNTLKINRLHFDACYSHLASISTTLSTHPPLTAAEEKKFQSQIYEWTVKSEEAKHEYERSKQIIQEGLVLAEMKRDELIDQGLKNIINVENDMCKKSIELLNAEKQKLPLIVKKKKTSMQAPPIILKENATLR